MSAVALASLFEDFPHAHLRIRSFWSTPNRTEAKDDSTLMPPPEKSIHFKPLDRASCISLSYLRVVRDAQKGLT